MRQDLADTVCQGLDGTIFKKCNRVPDRLDPKDKSEIQSIKADVVLMGNIKELKELGGLTVAQVEIKIVEKKTGKELLRMIDRQTTDPDKVAMPAVRKLLKVLNMEQNLQRDYSETEPPVNRKKASHVIIEEQEKAPEVKKPIPIEKKPEPAVPTVTTQETSQASLSFMVINQNKAKLRKTPNKNAGVLKTLNKGDEVKIVKQKDEWFLVELSGGDVGWCHKSALK